MTQVLQALQEFTVSVDYGRSHTTFHVRGGKGTPAIRVHKDFAHHALPEYRVFAEEHPEAVLGFIATRTAFTADRRPIGEVRRQSRHLQSDRWSVIQHDLGELTGQPKGINSKLRRAPVVEDFLGRPGVDALLSVQLRFSGPQSNGFDFSRKAGVRAEYAIDIRDQRVDRLLVLAWVVHFNEDCSVDPRKTAVDLTTNPFQGLGEARRAKRRRQEGSV